MASITLQAKADIEQMQFEKQRRRIDIETGGTPTEAVKGATAGGDERKLRGIPAIARGVAGAIPGSSPHHIR
jgi:hypothetical protein